MVKILIVEDDGKLNDSVCKYLRGLGYLVSGCFNATEAIDHFGKEKYDVIVSDIMMPQTDGYQLAQYIRLLDKQIPILFMTARDDMPSKQKGYEIGIDDYLVKPFALEELALRIGALVRRAKIAQTKRIEIGNFIMDEDEHTAYIDGKEIPLTVREFSLLYKLLSFPKKTFSRSALMDEFWGYDSSATSRAIDVCIAEIRKKTSGADGFEILTVHGLGYKAVLK